MERVRKVELPILCLASIKGAGGVDEFLYKSTRVFPALP